MNINLIITDNFYQDPDPVRQYALNQEFTVYGNYPGQRTRPVFYDSLKDSIQYIVQHAGGKITQFEEFEYNTAFQYTTAKDSSWIHSDQTTMWAGVCYLTPDAPVTAGTGLFKHKKTGWHACPRKEDGSIDEALMHKEILPYEWQDYTKWLLHDVVGNKFNRLVLYRGDYFHASLDYFGNTPENGRLFQTFFFNTEY